MSRTEALARQMYAAFRLWNAAETTADTPKWESLRIDMRDDFLKLAERMTMEYR